MRRVLPVLVLALVTAVALAGVAFAAFTDRETNPQTVTAVPSFGGEGTLSAQSRTNDDGASSAEVQLGLKLVNGGAESVKLSRVTLRYWFNNDHGSPNVVASCYYSQFGCNKVTLGVAEVNPARVGGDRVLTVGFRAGSLAAGASASLDQLAFRDQGGAKFDQQTDYSFKNVSSFTENATVTVYLDGELVWGTEPEQAPIAPGLGLEYLNRESNPQNEAISFALQLNNTGNVTLDLTKVTVRYWFTKDQGANSFQGACDYAQVGCGTVTADKFVAVTPPKPKADHYFQIGFSSGQLAVGNTTGSIQVRFNKADFSVFDETNDWSWATNTSFAANGKITVYYEGNLIAGTAP